MLVLRNRCDNVVAKDAVAPDRHAAFVLRNLRKPLSNVVIRA